MRENPSQHAGSLFETLIRSSPIFRRFNFEKSHTVYSPSILRVNCTSRRRTLNYSACRACRDTEDADWRSQTPQINPATRAFFSLVRLIPKHLWTCLLLIT